MWTNPSLHLYIDRDIILQEKMERTSFTFNFLILPIIAYYITCWIKNKTTIREFITVEIYKQQEIEKIYESERDKRKRILRLHEIETDTSIFKNMRDDWAIKIRNRGGLFLLINCYLCTCFCGIYENSIDCLITNVVMSIIFSTILSTGYFVLISILRFHFKKNDKYFNLSHCLNPSYYYSWQKHKDKEKKRREKKSNILIDK